MNTPETPRTRPARVSLVDVLRDRRAEPRPAGPEAYAQAMLRAHALVQVSDALASTGVRALVVKGAALALTVYADPAARPMGDVDLLVRRADRDPILDALARAGGRVHRPEGRAHSVELLGEIAVEMPAGALTVVVELHTSLDKIVPRPIDDDGLFARARPLPALPALLAPCAEDHALLVALHAAGHEFQHPIALLDLELLLRRGLDRATLIQRARAWRVETAMYLLLHGLRDLGAASVDDALVAAFEPAALRRAVALRCFAVRAERPAEAHALGLRWIVRQAVLRDDLGAWGRGVARYAALRARERLGVE